MTMNQPASHLQPRGRVLAIASIAVVVLALVAVLLSAGSGSRSGTLSSPSAPAAVAPVSGSKAPQSAAPAQASAPALVAAPSARPMSTPGASHEPLPSGLVADAVPGAETEALIAGYTARLTQEPSDHDTLLFLGLAYYQHARETADPSDYGRAQDAFDRLLGADPEDVEALIGSATISLARHDFAGALELGERARTVDDRIARVYGVIGDAQVELGRYEDALASVQAMVDLRPDLGSYSRVSYQRELHGQLDGAIEAMEDAVIAGGPATENTEYVRVILGNLWFTKGDLAKAEASYEASLAHSPGYVFALAGMARVRAAQGDLAGAIELYGRAADQVPFPEFLIALGEAQEAAGMPADAARTYHLVTQIEALFAANGVNTDLDLALFECDHGDPAHALDLARQAYAATPNIKAADALAWALYRNGRLTEARQHAEEALRLGTLDPSYLYHAGTIAAAQGDDAHARAWLGRSVGANPAWSPLHAPRAAAALAALGPGPVAVMPTEVPAP